MTRAEPPRSEAAPEQGAGLRAGDELELRVGAFAHGGHCVARYEGRVVFVRHALPGELVRARVSEVRSSLARADAVEILEASPDRVVPPCCYAGPGGCGGCDFQHVSLAAQRRGKAAVILELMARTARLEPDHALRDGRLADLQVGEVPGAPGGFGWRTRVQFAVDDHGTAGLRRHHSHHVVPIETCLLAHPSVAELDLTGQRWPGFERVEGIASSHGDRLVVLTPRRPETTRPRRDRGGGGRGRVARSGRGARPGPAAAATMPPGLPQRLGEGTSVRIDGDATGIGRGWVREELPGGGLARVTGSGFWQVHPGAPAVLVDAVLDQLDPQPGEQAWDLYGGVGLFSHALADRVGRTGSVVLVEGEARAVADARRNAHHRPEVRCVQGRVEAVLGEHLSRTGHGAQPPGCDLVVLDPPRSGAGRTVVEKLAALAPRAISYVACDPAALARDVATFAQVGYRLDALAAFDLFPHTQHVECVAGFVPVG